MLQRNSNLEFRLFATCFCDIAVKSWRKPEYLAKTTWWFVIFFVSLLRALSRHTLVKNNSAIQTYTNFGLRIVSGIPWFCPMMPITAENNFNMAEQYFRQWQYLWRDKASKEKNKFGEWDVCVINKLSFEDHCALVVTLCAWEKAWRCDRKSWKLEIIMNPKLKIVGRVIGYL